MTASGNYRGQYFTLILYLLLILVDIISAEITILPDTSLTKFVDDTFTVLCTNDKKAMALWRGPSNRPLGERTHPKAKLAQIGLLLLFERTKKEDSGKYICKTSTEKAEFTLSVQDVSLEATETSTQPESHISTTVITPSTEDPIVFNDTPTVQIVEEGQTSFVLRCEATGAQISWLIDGEAPEETKYNTIEDGIVINNVTREDGKKNYTCKAVSTNSGNMREQPITLKVLHKPVLPEHYEKQEIVYGYIGGTVNLSCEVEAEPPPNFRWDPKKMGQVLHVSPLKSVLMLHISRGSFRQYYCQAYNKHGELKIQFDVREGTQPNPPESMILKEAYSDSFQLEIINCNETENILPIEMQPFGYHIEYRLLKENDTTSDWQNQKFSFSEDDMYIVKDLQKNTIYEVRAATENSAGLSEFTNSSNFKTLSAANKPSFNLIPQILGLGYFAIYLISCSFFH